MYLRSIFMMFLFALLICGASLPAIALEKYPPSVAPIYFDFDSTALKSQTRQQLAEVAALMKNKPMLRVTLEGHTDERRSAEYSLALGERLVKVTKNYLVTLGIEQERISIKSFGKSKPAVTGHNEGAWAKNRRVEFVLTK